MAVDTEKWVESCSACAMNGRPEKPTPMQRILAPKAVLETIALDFNGPYVKFNGVSILVIVDYRSRYLIARPVKTTSFENTRVLEEVFEREGFPQTIKTDNGPPFNGEEYRRYCTERSITAVFSTTLFPQQNGLVESYMKVINRAMTNAATNKTNYIEELRAAIHAHNAATHSVTKLPPEEIMLGRKVKRGLPLIDFEKVTIDEELLSRRDRDAKLAAKEREDKRRGARPSRVKPGDVVIVERNMRGKGESRFSPRRYTVTEDRNGSLTLNNDEGQILKRHISQTRKVSHWRKKETNTSNNELVSSDANTSLPNRKRNALNYLSDYIRSVAD
ncbi:uncharacterized protein K02A2.6-like [Armigeres subalbatus]|uniref:uncharacterized protein K02A2.6-like n=1 Tax=Armigeres subalbatus TaxID=124917 RepID=UPI002ED25FC5